MDSYTLYKYIHLTGLVFWLGGLFSLSSFVRFISKQNDEYREKLAEYAYRIYYASNFIGLLLVIGSGLLLIMVVPGMMKNGWLHAKLLFVLILLAFDHLLMRHIKSLRKSAKTTSLINKLHIIVTILFFGILFLAVFKPF